VQADVLQVCRPSTSQRVSPLTCVQLCGRRTFYQLLVCDNKVESDVAAPYYSNQQLFPGFMMAEYDGPAPVLPLPLRAARRRRRRRRHVELTVLQAAAG
jgi:hypothetical protein